MIILNTQYIPAYPIPPVQIFHVAHLPEFWTGLPTCWSTKNINIILLSDGGLKDQGQFFDARPNFPTGVVIVIVFSFFVLFLMTTVNVNVIGHFFRYCC